MARKPTPKPGDDVTADYVALSNTAIDGKHFAQGDPITGITDRDQIALALRIGAIGPRDGASETAPVEDEDA
jgi:hypothetical protein